MREKCPELLEQMCIQSYLFAPIPVIRPTTTSNTTMEMEIVSEEFNEILSHPYPPSQQIPSGDKNTHTNTPKTMSDKFRVNYLGNN